VKIRKIALSISLLLIFIIIVSTYFQTKNFNIMPIKHGTVKPPLFYSEFFDNSTIAIESITLKGVFNTKPAPYIIDSSVSKSNGYEYRDALVFTDDNQTNYIILSDRDQVIYTPINYKTKVGWNPLSYYNDTELYIDGYWFKYSVEDADYFFIRPYWIGNPLRYELVERARQILCDQLGAEYVRKYFTVFPGIYGYQVYKNPNSFWNYAIMFKYDIRVGDYFSQNEVTVYFDSYKELVKVDRLPLTDNLQPFTISQLKSIQLAVKAGLPDNAHSYEVRILYWDKIRASNIHIHRYVWVIHAWMAEPYTNGSHAKIAYVDPHTGVVIGFDEVWVSIES